MMGSMNYNNMDTMNLNSNVIISLDDDSSDDVEMTDLSNLQRMGQYDDIVEKNELLGDFIDKCLHLENSDGMRRVINRSLIPAFERLSREFKKSDVCKTVISRALCNIERNPKLKFSYVKDLCESLKLNRSNKKMALKVKPCNRKQNSPTQRKQISKQPTSRKKNPDIVVSDDSDYYEVPILNLHEPVNVSLIRHAGHLDEPNGSMNDVQLQSENVTDTTVTTIELSDTEENINRDDTQHRMTQGSLLVPHTEKEFSDENMVSIEIQNIENEIGHLKETIARLETQEVTVDSTYSPYVVMDGLKARVVKLYEKLCHLTNKAPVKRREVRLKGVERLRLPIQILENFINSNIGADGLPHFPDFMDVVECVLSANMIGGLGWSRKTVLEEAHTIFSLCGRAMQRNRQQREWRDMLHLVKCEDIEDPADKDPELMARLEANRQLAKAKEMQLMKRWTAMQENGATSNVNGETEENAVVMSDRDLDDEVDDMCHSDVENASVNDVEDNSDDDVECIPNNIATGFTSDGLGVTAIRDTVKEVENVSKHVENIPVDKIHQAIANVPNKVVNITPKAVENKPSEHSKQVLNVLVGDLAVVVKNAPKVMENIVVEDTNQSTARIADRNVADKPVEVSGNLHDRNVQDVSNNHVADISNTDLQVMIIEGFAKTFQINMKEQPIENSNGVESSKKHNVADQTTNSDSQLGDSVIEVVDDITKVPSESVQNATQEPIERKPIIRRVNPIPCFETGKNINIKSQNLTLTKQLRQIRHIRRVFVRQDPSKPNKYVIVGTSLDLELPDHLKNVTNVGTLPSIMNVPSNIQLQKSDIYKEGTVLDSSHFTSCSLENNSTTGNALISSDSIEKQNCAAGSEVSTVNVKQESPDDLYQIGNGELILETDILDTIDVKEENTMDSMTNECTDSEVVDKENYSIVLNNNVEVANKNSNTHKETPNKDKDFDLLTHFISAKVVVPKLPIASLINNQLKQMNNDKDNTLNTIENSINACTNSYTSDNINCNNSDSASTMDEYQNLSVKEEPWVDIQNELDMLGDNFTTTIVHIEDPFLVVEISSDTSDDEYMDTD